MFYRYNCGNEVIRVFVYGDDFHTSVSVENSETSRSYDRTIREDENGRFFTWNHKKIYLNDWIRLPMKDLKERMEKGEWVTSDDLCQAILTEGVDNVRFVVPLGVVSVRGFGISMLNGSKCKDVLCKIEEDFNREVKNNYKIKVVPVVSDESVASSDDFYTSDFVSLIRSGHIKIAA